MINEAITFIIGAFGRSYKKNNDSKVSKVLFYETYKRYNDERNVLKQVVYNAEKAGEDMNVLWSLYESAFGPKEYFSTYWGNTRFQEEFPAYVTDEEWQTYLRNNPRASMPNKKIVLTPAQIERMNAAAAKAGLAPIAFNAPPDQSPGADKKGNQIILITVSTLLVFYVLNRTI